VSDLDRLLHLEREAARLREENEDLRRRLDALTHGRIGSPRVVAEVARRTLAKVRARRAS